MQLLLKNRGNDNHNGLTRIHQARLNKGLSIAEVCKRTGLSYDNYIKYERGTVKEQNMNLDTLRRLSEVLEDNFVSPYHQFKLNSAELVKQYMIEHQVSIRKFAAECGVSVTTIKHWRDGTCSPSYDIWERYFK